MFQNCLVEIPRIVDELIPKKRLDKTVQLRRIAWCEHAYD